ncbi:MAG TPA: segregation/condensation protein A [Anaerolineaceae bacterium]|nr:segregation/condensation protein A [Anaerolineaceae bacterium]
MGLQVAGFQTSGYLIETEVYEGPLDLLLELIEKAELDITSLALAQVTDQYLEYLNHLEERDAAQVSAFLVIAAKLLQIKSEALLPRHAPREVGEEDLGESLAQQLIIYKKFKEIGKLLSGREQADLRTYLHLVTRPQLESRLDMTGISLTDLVLAAQGVFSPDDDKPLVSEVVSIPLLTIRDKIRTILAQLKNRPNFTFSDVVRNQASRVDVIVTFLALLELVKRHIVEAHQDALFTDIEFEPVSDWNENEEFELDFGA